MAHKHQWLNHGVLFAAPLLALAVEQDVSNCMPVYALALALLIPRRGARHSMAP